MPGKAIRAQGVVQGVGFRPYIWRLAQQYQLTGTVWNDHQGVMIEAFGSSENLQNFIQQIPRQLPPLARLERLTVKDLAAQPPPTFQIVASHADQPAQTPISPDVATCPACLAEINDANHRRYRYAFTNCTHCGPRLSIVYRMPYDRCHTSLQGFKLCSECDREYHDPADRRFHAQATCCPKCGPKLWLADQQGQVLQTDDPIQRSVELLNSGHILAIKGLGGFHLACLASDENAVQTLRQRKHRYAKPFALMARDIEQISRYARLEPLAISALKSTAAPIVLLPAQGEKLAASIAPDDLHLGFMLPYTPLHSLLLAGLTVPIVLTSGNLSDEPPCIDNEEARRLLADIADFWLLHDRDIVNRLDDSVVRILNGRQHLLRRARGYSPQGLKLPSGLEAADGVLALGGELKNTFCLLKQGQAIVSQHIGDLTSASVQQDYRHALTLYRQLYAFNPNLIAIDAHPGYLSSQYGHQLAAETGSRIQPVLHHHAHLAACLAEHGRTIQDQPVLAAVFDGLGWGEDGQLWGGEFLLADYHSQRRLASFQAIALLGGGQAMREPWRNAYAQLRHYFDWSALQSAYADLEIMQFCHRQPLATFDTMLSKQLNAPLCSSCGRWFDAFAAVLGIHPARIAYEGQAAIALENLATPAFAHEQAYVDGWHIYTEHTGLAILSWRGLWQAVLQDLADGKAKAGIAARIHHTLIAASTALLLQLSQRTQTDTIVLSGGVFQNRLLLTGLTQSLENQQKLVLTPQQYPMNDGGLALGQAVIAAAQALKPPSGPEMR